MQSINCPVKATFFAKCLEQSENKSEFSTKIWTDAESIDLVAWHSVVPESDLFFNPSYLQTISKGKPGNVQCRYMLQYKNGIPNAVGIFQIIKFNANNFVDETDKPGWFRKLLNKSIQNISFKLLICGNSLTTGTYGTYFRQEEKEEDINGFLMGVNQLIVTEGIEGVLIKDFYEESIGAINNLENAGYFKARFQPNMVLDVDPNWKSTADYLAAMKSKYRRRIKKALEHISPLELKELNLDDITKYLPRIEEIYNQVIDESAFKLTKTDLNYYLHHKETLGEKFKVWGWFNDAGEMLSYISYYIDRDDLVAGFTGLERSKRDDYDLYLNILLTLVDKGITYRVKRIIFGRTAMEIKSSVGARPHNMVGYLRHVNPWKNVILKGVIKFLNKPDVWQLRQPFKVRE